MMSELESDLADWGVPANAIRTERFGPGSKRKLQKQSDPNAAGPDVVFRRSGKTVKWFPKAGNLWDLATANEIDIFSGCLEGDCGSCQTAIISGQVSYLKTTGFDCPDGSCLPCCCRPDGPLELDA